jgi:ABC-type transport system involved in multi-copper enzyme maturation permease subunit
MDLVGLFSLVLVLPIVYYCKRNRIFMVLFLGASLSTYLILTQPMREQDRLLLSMIFGLFTQVPFAVFPSALVEYFPTHIRSLVRPFSSFILFFFCFSESNLFLAGIWNLL